MIGRITVTDWLGHTSTYSYDLVSADPATALSDLEGIAAVLDLITASQVTAIKITLEGDVSGFGAPSQSGDNSNKAVLNVYTEAGEKEAVVEVPAPLPGLFVGGNTPVVDIGNATLQAYVAALASGTTVSDGETIDTASGTGGMKNGRWSSRSRRARV